MGASDRMTQLRRLDHVAIVVRDTEEALRFYLDHLGLRRAIERRDRQRRASG